MWRICDQTTGPFSPAFVPRAHLWSVPPSVRLSCARPGGGQLSAAVRWQRCSNRRVRREFNDCRVPRTAVLLLCCAPPPRCPFFAWPVTERVGRLVWVLDGALRRMHARGQRRERRWRCAYVNWLQLVTATPRPPAAPARLAHCTLRTRGGPDAEGWPGGAHVSMSVAAA